ncbi:MAG TPA: hypothetical protein VFB14_26750 [Bryobacteraceae bacterium]|jgi:hypothetical protein|nr:hypothetical protein [Bryobacteraceae bacterium]
MKRTLIYIAATLGCMTLSTAALMAQSSAAAYDIPFSFDAAGIQMPAGHYLVTPESNDVGLLRGDGHGMLFQRTPQLNAKPRAAHLTFHKYGDAYFLREVWDQSGRGNTVRQSPREHELRQTIEQARVHSQTVLVAATR